ncbi:MAG: Ig-like domain-containing protein [Acidobacteriaceae bacterium]|nr:Ig-like domain-containing protein [Acidobacteriaceae bacterium]
MKISSSIRRLIDAFCLFFLAIAAQAFATVTVSSPANNTTTSSTTVQYVASGSSSTCSAGVSAMGIYVDNALVYQVAGNTINQAITLQPGTHYTVVEEWDYCGGASTTPINITVTSGSNLNGVSVSSPTNGSTVASPVPYVATAGSTSCAAGIAAMGIYVNNSLAYEVSGSSLNTRLTLQPGFYNTVVQAWDYCGGAYTSVVNINVTASNGSVNVTSPTNGSTVSSPVQYVATATAAGSCSQGVAAMGVYANNSLVYQVNGSSLNTSIALKPGINNTVVQEWDYCGGAATTPINITVSSGSTLNGISVTSPAAGGTVTSPVKFVATAGSTTCAEGIAAMGIYINSTLVYQTNGSSLDTSLTLAVGSYNAVVEAWDYCGGALTAPLALKVSNIAITPSPATLPMGATQQFTAIQTLANGTTQDITSQATWTAGNTSVASISSSGLATALAAGSTTLTASYNGSAGIVPLSVSVAPGTGVNIPTWHMDANRSGLNDQEASLTPANVNPQTFGKVFSYLLDGYVYGEPLLISDLTIQDAKHNVLFAATENDSVYALDADTNVAPLWKVSLLKPGERPLTGGAIAPYLGVTSTPVIDPSTNTLYVVSTQVSDTGASYRLNALDITTGEQKLGGPVTLQASVPGTSQEAVNGVVSLNTTCVQRAALLLANGNIYIGLGGCKSGWLLAYNATSLAQVGVFNSSPNLNGEGTYAAAGGVWMGGGGPVADSSGNIYIGTGNGPWDGQTAYGDSVLKFSSDLKLEDYFTPAGYRYMNCRDADLASGGLLLIPSTGHLLIAGKTGKLYLLDSGNLGRQQASDAGATQTFFFSSGLVSPYTDSCTDSTGTHSASIISYEDFGTAAYYNNSAYVGVTPTVSGIPAGIRQFNYAGTLTPSSITTPNVSLNSNGATPFISANGSQNGIVWVLDQGQPLQNRGKVTPTNATLFAFDASNLANTLYSSSMNAADVPGYGIKFTSPVVGNGKVYISTGHDLTTVTNPMGEIDVYALH